MKANSINWTNTLFLSLSPILTAIGLWYFLSYEGFSWKYLGLFFIFYILTGFSITAGYHRLISHKAYKTNSLIKLFYLLFGAATFQNSAKKWCQDHRIHHNQVDTDLDPYNSKRGFFYSHIGWVCLNSEDHKKYDRDLAQDPLIGWQDKYYIPIAIGIGILLPTWIGYLMGSALGGLVFGAGLRIVCVHHCTFFINSLAHIWGSQPYSDQNTARDNAFLAFLTYGEGYHNFHHRFAGDYRNGLRWYHFDPTKWLIRFLSYLGWATGLKRIPEEEILKAKLRTTNNRLLKQANSNWKQEYLDKLENLRIKVEENQRKFRALKKEYKARKQELAHSSREKLKEMKISLQLAKADFKTAYHEWKLYSKALTV